MTPYIIGHHYGYPQSRFYKDELCLAELMNLSKSPPICVCYIKTQNEKICVRSYIDKRGDAVYIDCTRNFIDSEKYIALTRLFESIGICQDEYYFEHLTTPEDHKIFYAAYPDVIFPRISMEQMEIMIEFWPLSIICVDKSGIECSHEFCD